MRDRRLQRHVTLGKTAATVFPRAGHRTLGVPHVPDQDHTDRTRCARRAASTSDRRSRLLIYPEVRTRPWDTILLVTKGLKSSAQALDFAIELASEHGSNLVIAHVVRTPIDVGDDLDDGELTPWNA